MYFAIEQKKKMPQKMEWTVVVQKMNSLVSFTVFQADMPRFV